MNVKSILRKFALFLVFVMLITCICSCNNIDKSEVDIEADSESVDVTYDMTSESSNGTVDTETSVSVTSEVTDVTFDSSSSTPTPIVVVKKVDKYDEFHVNTFWDEYEAPDYNEDSPQYLYNRISDEFIDNYVANSSDGLVFGYKGIYSYNKELYGLVDQHGNIVCDPVYSNVYDKNGVLFLTKKFTVDGNFVRKYYCVSSDGTVVYDNDGQGYDDIGIGDNYISYISYQNGGIDTEVLDFNLNPVYKIKHTNVDKRRINDSVKSLDSHLSDLIFNESKVEFDEFNIFDKLEYLILYNKHYLVYYYDDYVFDRNVLMQYYLLFDLDCGEFTELFINENCDIQFLEEGYVTTQYDEDIGGYKHLLHNPNGEVISDTGYADNICEGVFAVYENDGNWRYIDSEGDDIEDLTAISEAVVEDDGIRIGCYFIDKNGTLFSNKCIDNGYDIGYVVDHNVTYIRDRETNNYVFIYTAICTEER